MENVSERYDELVSIIQEARYRYYVLSDPILSDREFDELFLELQKIEKENPAIIREDSPSQQVGPPVSEAFSSYTHFAPMQSLDNVFSQKELEDYFVRVIQKAGQSQIAYVCEPKIDGVAINLIYRNNVLVTAVTRGDGLIGENVTLQVKTISNIPKRLTLGKGMDVVEIRGEIYFPLKEFKEMNETRIANGEPAFMNPRNAASGALRQKDPSVTGERPLQFLAHSLGGVYREEGGTLVSVQHDFFTYHSDFLQWAHDNNFSVPSPYKIANSPKEAWEVIEEFTAKRHDFPYEIDGVVLKVNNLQLHDQLGSTARAPRWAIAYKIPPLEKETKLLKIEVNVGRTGKVTPYAVLEPVELSGVVITRATLHNETQIKLKDIRQGDVVLVRRAGDVIPEIVKAVSEKRSEPLRIWEMPKLCPFCNEPLIRPFEEVNYYCENIDCPNRIVESLIHFCSQTAMDIDTLGEKTIAFLNEMGILSNVADVYRLKDHKDDLQQLDGWGSKRVDNLLEAIENSKSNPLERLLVALNIRHVGPGAAKELAAHFPDIHALQTAGEEELYRLEGVGAKIADSVVTWFKNEKNSALLTELIELGVRRDSDLVAAEEGSKPLVGKTFVITGTFENISRDNLKTRLEALGAKVTNSVSKNTTALILGKEPGSKLEKANSLNIDIITEDNIAGLLDMQV